MTQYLVGWISVALIAALGAIFLSVAGSAGSAADYAPIQEAGARARRRFFWTLLGVTAIASAITLRRLPYRSHADSLALEQAVRVIGHQWAWEMKVPRLTAGHPIDFQVTSADVTHGFAIFDDRGHLVAQVQAMPGYINHLHFTFDQAGVYTIMCLEYCGVVHHAMRSSITVRRSDLSAVRGHTGVAPGGTP
jgi:cytochrome c oxidase subunit II